MSLKVGLIVYRYTSTQDSSHSHAMYVILKEIGLKSQGNLDGEKITFVDLGIVGIVKGKKVTISIHALVEACCKEDWERTIVQTKELNKVLFVLKNLL
ncbi:hypothetical protein VNO77_25806 [Canavalia gladiata]|uniref:Uncharacterized protein n=1 Tax=Canavalia gladiata TaxID=3824 RepID=A0AAN9Q538_CANGL